MKIILLLCVILATNKAYADCLDAAEDICTIEERIWELVNQYREGKGKPALSPSMHLGFVSRAWSKEQAEVGRISHRGFPGARSERYKTEFPYLASPGIKRENVAMFSGGSPTPIEVAEKFHKMWINSPGHAANIRATDCTTIGIGVFKTGSNAYYATQLFSK